MQSELLDFVLADRQQQLAQLRPTPELLNQTDSMGQTVLFHAAAKGNLPMCECLLKLGADPLVIDKCQQSVLDYGRLSQNIQLVIRLKDIIKQRQEVRKKQRKEKAMEVEENPKQCYRIKCIEKDGRYRDLTKQEVERILGHSVQDHQTTKINLKSDWLRIAYKIMKRLTKEQHGDNQSDWLSYSQQFHKSMREKKPDSRSVDLISIMGKITHKIYQSRHELTDDIKLMEENCKQLFGSGHPVTKKTIQVRKEFFRLANDHNLYE